MCECRWKPILSVEDLPKEDGDYLWQDFAQNYEVEFFCTERNNERFAQEYIAWQKIDPFEEKR